MNRRNFDPDAAKGIEPCDGWALQIYPEDDGDRFTTTGFMAVQGEKRRFLGVSRFHFTATQERFDWLVRSGFAACPKGSWTDNEIDAAIATAARKAA